MKIIIRFSFLFLLAACSTTSLQPIAATSNDNICLPENSFHEGDQIRVFKNSCSYNPSARYTKPICRKEIIDSGVVLTKTAKNCYSVKLNHINEFDQTTYIERQ